MNFLKYIFLGSALESLHFSCVPLVILRQVYLQPRFERQGSVTAKKAQVQMGRETSTEEKTVLVLPLLPICAVIVGKSSPSPPLSYMTSRPLPAQICQVLSGYL